MLGDTVTVLMSGGLDSMACAHFLKRQCLSVKALFIDFGQAAAKPEWTAAEKVSSELGIGIEKASLRTSHNFSAGEVIGRNAFFIMTAVMIAPNRPHLVGIGIHGGTPYFDCSPEFLTAVSNMVQDCSNGRCNVVAPFVDWSKANIYAYICEQNIRYENTYSCEVGAVPPCGSCLSCKDRVLLGVG